MIVANCGQARYRARCSSCEQHHVAVAAHAAAAIEAAAYVAASAAAAANIAAQIAAAAQGVAAAAASARGRAAAQGGSAAAAQARGRAQAAAFGLVPGVLEDQALAGEGRGHAVCSKAGCEAAGCSGGGQAERHFSVDGGILFLDRRRRQGGG